MLLLDTVTVGINLKVFDKPESRGYISAIAVYVKRILVLRPPGVVNYKYSYMQREKISTKFIKLWRCK